MQCCLSLDVEAEGLGEHSALSAQSFSGALECTQHSVLNEPLGSQH